MGVPDDSASRSHPGGVTRFYRPSQSLPRVALWKWRTTEASADVGASENIAIMKRHPIANLGLLAMTVLGCFAVSRGNAAPQPAAMSRTWQFEFQSTTPEPIAIPDGNGGHDWYWYLPYTVTNTSKRDRAFLPVLTIATDQGDIVRANQNIAPSVFTAIRMEMQNPLLQSPMAMPRTLKRGRDHMRRSVAIWPAFEGDVDQMSIFITGLSGEHTTVIDPATGEPVIDPGSLQPIIDPRTKQPTINPATGEPVVDPKPLLLRKTLMIDFDLAGTVSHPQQLSPLETGRRWIMR